MLGPGGELAVPAGDVAEPSVDADDIADIVVAALTAPFTEVLDGRSSYVTDGVQRALGRPPRDVADYARDANRSGA